MQTNFTAEQLADPSIAEVNAILKSCVHYGFCTNTCPTYVLSRDENESPRGRIDLINKMLEIGGPPDPSTVKHLDNCLSCLSCMTTCAAKVDYVHLIDHARAHIERHFRRPFKDRQVRRLLVKVLPYPRRFQLALVLGRLAKPFARLMPSALRPLVKLIPSDNAPKILKPQVFKAQGKRRYRVALLAGCAQQVLNRNINEASIRLLQRHGCDVVIADGAGCCGSLALHIGQEAAAKTTARRTITAWSREIEAIGLDAIIINASGCGTTIKDYGHLFARDDIRRIAEGVSRHAVDITEFLARIGLQAPEREKRYRISYHDPCSMQHGQKVVREPRELLKKAGFLVQDVPEKHFCCGSAGTYNILHPDVARQLGERKASHIRSTDSDLLATGNIGCMTQMGQYLDLPILHTVELLDWATGGPLPPALEGRLLREQRPETKIEIISQESTTEPPPSVEDASGYW
ncbi:glycolate oxidase subunit GlcF [Bradyrhizobium sp. 14AA]